MFRLLPVVALVAILAACSRPGSNAAATTDTSVSGTPAAASAAATAAVKPVPAQLPDVIARVNGDAISRADFESAVANIEANAGTQLPPAQRDQVLRQLLDEMIGYRLMIQETRARKMTLPNGDIDARVAQFRARFPTEEVFKQTLERQKMTMERLRANALNDLLVQRLLEAEIGPKLAVTPAEVDYFYANNPDQFQQAERVRASHILFAFPQGADPAARELARTRAAAVLKDVRAGKDFAELAKVHSQDPGSGANGGDLGYFQQGQMVPPFEKVAFSLKAGQTSDLVETEFGVHIIRVEDHQVARTLPIDEIRPQLQQFIIERKRQSETEAFVNGLRAKSTVEIFI